MDLVEEFKDLKISVVLPAGGTGERIGVKPFKQFYQIQGKPLMCFSVEAFESFPWIDQIIIVVAEDQMEQTKMLCQNYKKVRFVVAGKSRHRSIAAGIKYFEKQSPDIVIIHDVVRPLVPSDVLIRVVNAARVYKAAGPICPLTSTVISRDENGFLDVSLDRNKYFASEMPQAFNYKVIFESYDKCSEHDFDFGTECLHLVHKYCNIKAKLIDGSPDLWKVTYKKDLHAAEVILKEKTKCSLYLGSMGKNLSDQITSKLKSQVLLGNEVFQSFNCVIFHENCALSENLNCCIPEIYKSTLPNKIINVLYFENVDVEPSVIFDFIEEFSKTIELTSKMCFTIWKRSKDWSDEIITNLTDLIADLLHKSNKTFCKQVFVI